MKIIDRETPIYSDKNWCCPSCNGTKEQEATSRGMTTQEVRLCAQCGGIMRLQERLLLHG